MADSIGDLKISVILDVATAEKNAQKVSTSLRSVETEAKKTTDAVSNVSKGLSDVDKSTQKVTASTTNLKGNITGLGYGFVDLSRNLSMSTSLMGDLVGTMGAAIGTGSVLAGSIIALGSALAGLEKYTGFQINPTGGVQTGVIERVIDAKVKDIVDAAYLKAVKEGKVISYADRTIMEMQARMDLKKEISEVGPGNKWGHLTYDANKPPDPVKVTGSGPANIKPPKEIIGDLIKAERELVELRKVEATFTADQRGQLVFVNYLREVYELTQKIAGLKLSSDFLKVTAGLNTAGELGQRLAIESIKQPKSIEEINKAIEDQQPGVNFKDAMGEGLNLATQISSVLGLGADNFINTFLSGIQTGISLISSFASLLSILSGGASGGFLSILGFASGGSVPGAGTGDSVPAMLTPGEFVINKRRASQLGTGFLQWLNGGGAVNSQITPGMMGGGNLTIIANGQLTDALSFQVVDKGMKLRNMKIERSSY